MSDKRLQDHWSSVFIAVAYKRVLRDLEFVFGSVMLSMLYIHKGFS